MPPSRNKIFHTYRAFCKPFSDALRLWARRNWHEYYDTIQNMVVVFSIVFFALQAFRVYKFSKEEKDELAIQNLRRTDAVGLKIMIAAAIIIAFACAVKCIDGTMAGFPLR